MLIRTPCTEAAEHRGKCSILKSILTSIPPLSSVGSNERKSMWGSNRVRYLVGEIKRAANHLRVPTWNL